jgi:hypothetical protein
MRRWCNPCSEEYWEMILGPVEKTPDRLRTLRRRWWNGGREAVAQHFNSPGERAWAWWHFDAPKPLLRKAMTYATDAEAILALGLDRPGEREEIEQRGVVEQQRADLETEGQGVND